jgi:DNA-binding MarR family transcriptional regulator
MTNYLLVVKNQVMPDRRSEPRGDSIDRVLASWSTARPDLDVAPLAVVGRITRINALLRSDIDEVFARHGLSGTTFALLATLVRLGRDAGVSQRRLADELGLTPGTVSVRVDHLVEEGLVRREPDPDDRRGLLIRPTADGLSAFERCAPAHLANERRLLSVLTDERITALAELLRDLLSGLEEAPEASPAWLGARLLPAHDAIGMRTAVGLSPTPGVLVQEVSAGGPLGEAGVERGDLLRAAGGAEMRTVADLAAALADASGPLALDVLRGESELRLETRG